MKLDSFLNEIREDNPSILLKQFIENIRNIAGKIANGPFGEKDSKKLINMIFKLQDEMIKIQKREKK